jgi:hypothetical protein
MISVFLQHIDPKLLTPHPLSEAMYGRPTPSQSLVDSIQIAGIIEPLVVLPDYTIVSGHTRRAVAISLGMEKVPCIVRQDFEGNPLEIEKLVIESNCQRVKTNDVLAREAAKLMAIESKLADVRRKENLRLGIKTPDEAMESLGKIPRQPDTRLTGKSSENVARLGIKTPDEAMESLGKIPRQPDTRLTGKSSENVARLGIKTPDEAMESLGKIPRQPDTRLTGKSSENVAKSLGIGRDKAASLATVGKAIEQAEKAGDEARSAELKAAVNQSVPKAVALVKKKPAKAPKPPKTCPHCGKIIE